MIRNLAATGAVLAFVLAAPPTMVMLGDADIVRPEHAVEMFRLLPHGQLAVLPASDHFVPMQRPAWISSMTRAFLVAPMPQTK